MKRLLLSTVAVVVLFIAVTLTSNFSVKGNDDGQNRRDRNHEDEDALEVQIGFRIAPVKLNLKDKDPELVGLGSSCLSGCFSTTQYVGMGSWLNGLEGLCRPVSADMRSAYARFRDRAGSGMRPLVACADCAERQIHQDKPEADRGSRRDRFQSAIAADSQWRGPPKAAPTSRLCADRFAGAEDEAHAEIRLAATPQSS